MTQIDSSTLQSASRKPRSSHDQSPRTVTKTDILRAICAHLPAISLRQARGLMDSIIEEVAIAFGSDESVKLQNIGLFRVRHKRERPGRNPRNGVAATVKSRNVVVFRASTKLKAAVANNSLVNSTKSPARASRKRPRKISQTAS